MSRPIIEVRAISKRYRLGALDAGTFREEMNRTWERLRGTAPRTPSTNNDFWALRDVSFQVQPGDVIGIIGRNGAGKSTLLKILSRITEPTSGRAVLRGRIGSLLEVGTGFHPELSGRENIYLNGAILGMKRAEIDRKFDEIVAFSEVEKFLDTPVKRYSSGMYVRLAFAVAAHLEPEILIVDEVLAVGDTQFQKKCIGKMQDVATGGRTVLFVSHNLQAIRSLCNRCVLLANGQLLLDAPTDQAIAEYTKDGLSSASLVWDRPAHLPRPTLAFETIRIQMLGHQPRPQLKCELDLVGTEPASPVFIAVDICDQMKIPIMQALPEAKPFIPARVGLQRLVMEIDLPPLIPGVYSLNFWIGPHFTLTTDYVKAVVTFEIDESPTPGRDYPHTPAQGFLVPVSRCEVLPA